MLTVFTQYWWQFLVVCIVGYLVGATNFAILFSRLIKLQDVRKFGSGNAGSTNMFRVYGLSMGLLTFFCDALKSVVCIFLSKWIFASSMETQALTQLMYTVGLFVVIGHVLPVYYNFRGGKGVAPSIGCMFSLQPILALCLVLPLFLVVLIFDRTSVGSIALAIIVLVLSWVMVLPKTDLVCAICLTLIFLLVLFAHRGNIARLLSGKEKRIGLTRAILGKIDKK